MRFPTLFLRILPLILCLPLHARTFTNLQGVTVEAEIKAVVAGQVTMVRQSDRREFILPIASLSEADQTYIREWQVGGGNPAKPVAPVAPKETPTPSPDSQVQPGARFFIEFPKLYPDRHGEVTKVGVSIPNNYDPTKPVPLIAWMQGGDGGNNPSNGGVVDRSRFVTVGLPFPKGADNPRQANMVGDFDTIWEKYHKPILEEIFRQIPNIDRRLCILSGFSNGAHTIAGVLQTQKNGGYPQYFNCYILIEGGNGSSSLKGGKDNFLFAAWGEDSIQKPFSKGIARSARGMITAEFEMPETGHKYADSGRDAIKKWMDEVVIPATIGN